jgi:DNA-binding beta-propeller fold protein YncE
MLLTFMLSACGGGGGGDMPTPTPAVTTLSGLALDGYLRRAKVCLDVNGNGRCDAGEPSTETAEDGSFSLNAPEAQASSAAVLVEVIPGTTIDTDSNDSTPVTQAFTLTAPIGSSTVISPLTTLVAARMADGAGLDLARIAVSSLLGLSPQWLMGDYVAGQATPEAAAAHRVAVAVARLMADVESGADPAASLQSRLEAVSNGVAATLLPRLEAIKRAPALADVRRMIDDAIFEETASYAVAGSVQGLGASGLKLAQAGVVIDIVADAKGFEFPAKQPSGAAYQVSIAAQPAGQSCAIDNGQGTVTADLGDRIAVRCQSTPGRLSGTIAGLAAPGLGLELELANGAQRLSIPLGATSFRFETPINAGEAFSLQVAQQPAAQFCSVAGGAGTMVAQGVNTVEVTCSANAYTLGGTVRGLSADRLELAQGSQSLAVLSGAASFQFATRLAFGSAYSVSISRQPQGLYCSLADSAGVVGLAPVQSVEVACAASGQAYRVGGAISGLADSGLVLRMGSETLSIASGASSFQFASRIANTGRYVVSVESQPELASCSVAQAAGTVSGADVSSVTVTCRNKRLYALSTDRLSIVDLVSGQSLASLQPGVTLSAMATAPRSSYVLVADSFLRALHVIDDRTGQAAAGSPLMLSVTPSALVLDPGGTRAYVVDERVGEPAGYVSVIDTSDPAVSKWSVVGTIPVGQGPVAAYASSVRPHLYVLNRAERSVSVIHTASLSVIRTYGGLGVTPSALTAGSGETKLYIADEGARSLITLDLATGETSTRLLDITHAALARSPDGRSVYLLNERYLGDDLIDTVTRLDTVTNSVSAVTVGDSPLGLAISAGGTQIYTAEATAPSGVTVISNAGGMSVLKRIPIDFLPVAIAVK